MELELAAFKQAIGIEGETFTKKATFFEGYNWRDLRCYGCNRHIGWKFHHDDLQKCINDQLIKEVAVQADSTIEKTPRSELDMKKVCISLD